MPWGWVSLLLLFTNRLFSQQLQQVSQERRREGERRRGSASQFQHYTLLCGASESLMMASSSGLLVCILFCLVCVGRGLVEEDKSIVMTMIIRDEAVNINSNLHLWLGIVDYFVFLLDERTQDDSDAAIRRILDESKTPYRIDYHEFDGFGSARTKSLQKAWKYFPQATFVWIADPDWKPEVSTIRKSDLTTAYDAFRFTIIDRSGITTRQCDWLLLHKEGLRMRYHLHEVLDNGAYSPTLVNWVIHEIEQPGSWHTTVGHANSFAAKRTLFDLDLLYKDLEQYGHDPHVHKYLGVTHLSYVNDIIVTAGDDGIEVVNFSQNSRTPEIEDHFKKGNYYCELRANPNTVYEDEFREERWDCMMQMALTASVVGLVEDAEKWYLACHQFSPGIPRCMFSLVSLLSQINENYKAFSYLQILLTTTSTAREGINYRAMDECLVPKLAMIVLLRYANENDDYAVTLGFAQYLRALMSMITNPICDGFVNPKSDITMLSDIIESMSSLMGLSTSISPCDDKELHSFISENGYTVHNC